MVPKSVLRGFACSLVVLTAYALPSCGPSYPIAGECTADEDCHQDFHNFGPHSLCMNERCSCPPGLVSCCAIGTVEGDCQRDCRVREQCKQGPEPEGDGGSGDVPVLECMADSDCAQPPDGRCGKGYCLDGVCKLDLKAGPIASQRYGDCKSVGCDFSGNVVEVADSADVFNDGKQCTLDYCDAGNSVSLVLADGTPCPESGEGYCLEGECVECIVSKSWATCGDDSLYCAAQIYCVPTSECPGANCGGVCAPCLTGSPCTYDADCVSDSCYAGQCQAPSCRDGKKNDGETGIDCGTPSCGPCPSGEGCSSHEQCLSGVCMQAECQEPTCFDGVKNGDETGTDCGGTCGPC